MGASSGHGTCSLTCSSLAGTALATRSLVQLHAVGQKRLRLPPPAPRGRSSGFTATTRRDTAPSILSFPIPLPGETRSGLLAHWSILVAATGWLSWNQKALEANLSQPSSLGASALGQMRAMPHTRPAVQVPDPGGHFDPLLLSLQSPHPLGREHLLPRDVLQVRSRPGPGLSPHTVRGQDGALLLHFPWVCFWISAASLPSSAPYSVVCPSVPRP